MSRYVWLLEEPWGLFNKDTKYVNLDTWDGFKITLDYFPSYIVIPCEYTVEVGDCRFKKCSSSFELSGGYYRCLSIPMAKLSSTLTTSTLRIRLANEVRTHDLEVNISLDPDIEASQAFIKWQTSSFQSLSDLDLAYSEGECLTKHGVRKSWHKLVDFWLSPAIAEQQGMASLVVKVANDGQSFWALEKVLKNPTKILKRRRSLESISKVQELDSSCLQWYIRQPGTTVEEKAGSRQKIMAVTREETYVTLENRVSRWVVERLLELAREFLADNKCYEFTDKFQIVRKFQSKLGRCFESSIVKTLSPLGVCSHPNYVLTYHHYYKQIWKLFMLLKSHERLQEDLWRWQQQLWSETARQLLGALLKRKCQNDSKWAELAVSSSYIRKDHVSGLWTDSPVAPGPFKTAFGRIDYIDLRDGRPDEATEGWMALMGCQQILKQRRQDGSIRMMAVWFWHARDSIVATRMIQDCQSALSHIKAYTPNKPLELSGLVVIGNASGTEPISLVREGSVAVLAISSSYRDSIDELCTYFDSIMDYFSVTAGGR